MILLLALSLVSHSKFVANNIIMIFVEYIYQVSVGNSAGNAFSGWVAVTSEGSGKDEKRVSKRKKDTKKI